MNKMFKWGLWSTACLIMTSCAQLSDVDHKWCPPATPTPALIAPPQAPTTERITLAADVLFAFDKANANDLLPKGRAQLDQIVQKIQSGQAQIERIELIGHTDRLGAPAYNERLGMARAEAIRTYLINHGVQTQINVASKGASEPVTTECVGTKATAALKACLQPDRRVTLDITGVVQSK